jgi:hypothetical protein
MSDPEIVSSKDKAITMLLRAVLAFSPDPHVRVFVDPDIHEEVLERFRAEGPREGNDMGFVRWADCAMCGYQPDAIFILKRYGSICEPCDRFSAVMAFYPYVHVTMEYYS